MPGVIYDRNGNIVGTSTNIDRFIVNKQGEIINPSTEELLIDIKDILNNSNDAKLSDIAKETTLSNINSKIQTTINGIKVDGSHITHPVNVVDSILPPGAATENTLSQINSKLTSENGLLKVDASDTTVNVNVVSSILPVDAAKDITLTNGNQKTQIVYGSNTAKVNNDGTIDINLKRIDADIDLSYLDDSIQIYGYDGTTYKPIKVDENGNLSVNVISSILPNNAATETTLSAINSNITGPLALENGNLSLIKSNIEEINNKIDNLAQQNTLSSIDTKIIKTDKGILIDGSNYTQNVNVISSVLPTNAANATNQQTIINKLNDIYNNVASEITLAYINSKISIDSNNKIYVNADGSNINANIVSTVLPPGAATDNTLINGNAKFRILDNNGNPITSTNGALDVNIKSGAELTVNLNAANDSVLIYGYDLSSNTFVPIKVDSDGFVLINKDNLANSAKQDISNNLLSEINNKVATENTLSQINNKLTSTNGDLNVNVTNSSITAVVSSSVLPTGAATSAKQDISNDLLTQIRDKIPVDGNGYIIINKDNLATSNNQTLIYSLLNDKIDVDLSTRASENTLTNVNSNIILVKNSVDTISSKQDTTNNNLLTINNTIEQSKVDIVNQLDTRVRGLFDSLGNPIDTKLIPIINNRGLVQVSIPLFQVLAFSNKLFSYTHNMNINAGDTNVLSLINPVNSGKTIMIYKICVARNQDYNNSVFFVVRKNSTVSGGTLQSVNSTYFGGTSIANLYTTPTITNGVNLTIIGINASESSKLETFDFCWGLLPGENLAIIGNANANGVPCFISISWAEV